MNNITDIKILKDIYLKNLITLNLDKNFIQNLKILEKLDIPNIECLSIYSNSIDYTIQKNIDINNNLNISPFFYPFYLDNP